MGKTRRMKVVWVEDGKPPQLKTVGAELCDLQSLFDNELRVHYSTSDSIALIFDKHINAINEDGKNTLVFTGAVIICGFSRNRFCSLTQAQQEKYLKQFSLPENCKKCWRT
ncbi:MAG: hypothetical protein IJE16_07535 [Ruminococcus sp.]|nr:hypothetical protein [Ruminococcus sp.]